MSFLDVALAIGYALLSLSLILAFLRLLRGPTLSDRVVALDFISAVAVSFIALYTISSRDSVYLDAAVVIALIAFLGTVAFARYVEWQKET
ncbi:MAG: monovalent cation/H+ antiporter complex subunit F [Trueperaceae bacterium]